MNIALIDGGYFVKRLQKHWLPDVYGNMKFWNDKFERKKIDIDELNENLYRIFDNDVKYLEIIMNKIDRFDKVIILYDGIYGRRARGKYYKNYKKNRSGIHALKHKGIDITEKIEKCLFDPYQLRPSWISEMDMFKEADDLIAEYIEENPMEKITIFSTDGDMYQFLNRENVSLHNFTKTITKQEIEDKIGLPIDKYVSWKTLVGDSSDNLPGMRGYGPQKAKLMLEDYDSFLSIPKEFFVMHYISAHTVQDLGKKLKKYRKSHNLSIKKVSNNYGSWWKRIEDGKKANLNKMEYDNLCNVLNDKINCVIEDHNPMLNNQYRVIKLPFKEK